MLALTLGQAHGRPRIVNPADCNLDPPSIYDFPDPNDLRAHIFVSYVSITGIMCELCNLLTRHSDPPLAERNRIGLELLDYIRTLPANLRLIQPDGIRRPYSLDLAQLHVFILTTIIILYRPQSMFHIPRKWSGMLIVFNQDPYSFAETSAPAIVASSLNFRIFEAMELRGHTCSLTSGFSWHLLVTSIPHLSCLAIPPLREEFKANLDALEGVFQTLGRTKPSAANNLRNIQAIRRAFESKDTGPLRPRYPDAMTSDGFSFSPLDLFEPYGPDISDSYSRVVTALQSSSNASFVAVPGETNPATSPAQSGPMHEPTPNVVDHETGLDDFGDLLGSNFPEDGWMRNWINELNLFSE
jgi:hypothetical protein